MNILMPRFCVSFTGRSVVVGLVSGFLLVSAVSLRAQTLQERIDNMERRLARQAEREREREAQAELEVNRRLAARIDFAVEGVRVRDALEDWSAQTRVALAIDWEAMEIDGVDPKREVTVALENVRADTVLLVIMNAMSIERRFIAEAYGWGVQLRTRERANEDVVTRVYDVRDLLVDVPAFTDAPRLSLTEALSNTSSGGGGGSSGGGGIFDLDEFDEENDRPLTRAERGALLAELLRDTIEPDVWRANGGAFSRVRYRDGRLIVRAPRYVHTQIGRPAIAWD